MLSKNVQNCCIVYHWKILRAAPYFAHLSNFKITTNTQISSKSQGSALAIFAHIFNSIDPVLRKLRAKMHFFTFSKTSKNTYMTPKIHLPNYWYYEFSSYFGFGLKQSIAIFSAIQNVIWSWFDDFRAFWKLLDFPFLTCFSSDFFAVFCM